MRKIRELGSLPAFAFEKYQNLTLSQVRQSLNSVTQRGLPIVIIFGGEKSRKHE